MVKILTVCKHGLCRSAALADVLKFHFKPVDVIPIGVSSNDDKTLIYLANWADYIIIMEKKLVPLFPKGFESKIKLCDVGPDVYGNSRNRQLIDTVWDWTRLNTTELGIVEHKEKI